MDSELAGRSGEPLKNCDLCKNNNNDFCGFIHGNCKIHTCKATGNRIYKYTHCIDDGWGGLICDLPQWIMITRVLHNYPNPTFVEIEVTRGCTDYRAAEAKE